MEQTNDRPGLREIVHDKYRGLKETALILTTLAVGAATFYSVFDGIGQRHRARMEALEAQRAAQEAIMTEQEKCSIGDLFAQTYAVRLGFGDPDSPCYVPPENSK
ncbi:hypothetical protein ACFLZX_03450 [Nanoarchaeota archaeon]